MSAQGLLPPLQAAEISMAKTDSKQAFPISMSRRIRIDLGVRGLWHVGRKLCSLLRPGKGAEGGSDACRKEQHPYRLVRRSERCVRVCLVAIQMTTALTRRQAESLTPQESEAYKIQRNKTEQTHCAKRHHASGVMRYLGDRRE